MAGLNGDEKTESLSMAEVERSKLWEPSTTTRGWWMANSGRGSK
jgi:hypothetical protein